MSTGPKPIKETLYVARKPNGAFVCLSTIEHAYKAFGLSRDHTDKIRNETRTNACTGECTLFLKSSTIVFTRANAYSLWQLAKEIDG